MHRRWWDVAGVGRPAARACLQAHLRQVAVLHAVKGVGPAQSVEHRPHTAAPAFDPALHVLEHPAPQSQLDFAQVAGVRLGQGRGVLDHPLGDAQLGENLVDDVLRWRLGEDRAFAFGVNVRAVAASVLRQEAAVAVAAQALVGWDIGLRRDLHPAEAHQP